MTAPMDAGFAVFNLHVNRAGERADAAFIERFGREAWERKIQPLHERGIMSIFDKAPSRKTLFWVLCVTDFVNENVRDYEPVLPRLDDMLAAQKAARKAARKMRAARRSS